MVVYIIEKDGILTYLGYTTKEESKKVTVGPNGTYIGKEGFIKDKSKGLEVDEFFVGRCKEFKYKPTTVIKMIDVPTYLLSKEDVKRSKVPELIRHYVVSLTNYNNLFDRVIPGPRFFNPDRDSNPLFVGNNIFITPSTFNGFKNNKHYVITNPPLEIGRNSSTALYSIVYTSYKVEHLEAISKLYNVNTDGFENPICVYRDNINKAVVAMVLRDNGLDNLQMVDIDFHREKIPVFKLAEDTKLIEMLFPPALAFRAFERLETLDLVYNKYRNDKLEDRYTVIDITDKIWCDKDICSDFKSGKKLRVITAGNLPISFIPDIDVPSFNSLRKLSKRNPKCKLILEDEGASSSYMFVIESELGHAIYYSMFSNRVFKRAIRKKK